MPSLSDVGSKGFRSHNKLETLRYIMAVRIRDIFGKSRNSLLSNNKGRLSKVIPFISR